MRSLAALALLAMLALVTSGCGGNKNEPILAANLVVVGTLSVSNCQVFSVTGLFNCGTFSGIIRNTGPGCAANVRGTTVSVFTDGGGQIGSAGWSYSGTVRDGEQFNYTGGPIVVAQTGLWEYVTTPSWDNVRCR
jgi:hypothetical protein